MFLQFTDWHPSHLLCFNCCRLKIFAPISVLAFIVLVPVNWTNDTLQFSKVEHSDVDKLSISNIPVGSKRLALIFLFWNVSTALDEAYVMTP